MDDRFMLISTLFGLPFEWLFGTHGKQHIGDFEYYLDDISEKSEAHSNVLTQLAKISKAEIKDRVKLNAILNDENKKDIVNDLWKGVLELVKRTLLFDPIAHKTGNLEKDSIMYCWKFLDTNKYLVIVATRNRENGTFSDVNTLYLNTHKQYRAKFASLLVMLTNERIVLKNYNDYNRRDNKFKKPTQVLANLNSSKFNDPELFKNQGIPEDERINIARLHPNVDITNKISVSDIIQFHCVRTFNDQFHILLTSNFFGHGVIPSLLRHGNKFKACELIDEDIMDVFDLLPEKKLPMEEKPINYKNLMKEVITTLRNKDENDWTRGGFDEWLAEMEHIPAYYLWKIFFEIEGLEERSFNNITSKLRVLQKNTIKAIKDTFCHNQYTFEKRPGDTILLPIKNYPGRRLVIHLADDCELRHQKYTERLRIILEVDIESV